MTKRLRPARSPGRALGALWLSCLAGACDPVVDVAAVPAPGSVQDGGAAGACQVSAEIEVEGTPRCLGEWLAERLTTALCSCEDLAASAAVTVDAFDAHEGAYTTGSPGGDLSVDGALNLQAGARLRGALAVAGAAGSVVGAGQTLHVEGAFATAGDLVADGARVELGADARVEGQLIAETLTVAGTLQMPDPSRLQVAGASDVGTLRMQGVSVAPACRCEALALPPPAAASEPSVDADGTLTVCASQRIGALNHDADLTIRGAGVLQIEGDLAVGGELRFDVPDAATLHVLVGGNLRISGGLRSEERGPRARVHLIVAGNGTLQIQGDSRLQGSLVAPRAELVSAGPLEVFGALAVRRAAVSAALDVHHDRSLAGDARLGCP